MYIEEFILSDNIDLVLTKITKLNKKATKLNVAPVKVTVTDETKVETQTSEIHGEKITESFYYTKIIIEGENPQLSGWSLVAVKVNDPDMGLMINSVPDKEMPIEFRTSDFPCEHCNHNRVRNNTYILEKQLKELTEDEMRYM